MTDDFPIEFAWPDITPYAQGNTGVPYVHTFDSGKPGRHVMVNAVTHGNELCGAVAVDLLFKLRIRPKQGKLTPKNTETVEIVGLYWHFVDVVWILIFTVIYLIPVD